MTFEIKALMKNPELKQRFKQLHFIVFNKLDTAKNSASLDYCQNHHWENAGEISIHFKPQRTSSSTLSYFIMTSVNTYFLL